MAEKKLTLLQKAKMVEIRTKPMLRITDEDIELALAWANDEITIVQAGEAYGMPHRGSSVYSRIALSLKKHHLASKENKKK